MRNRIWTELTQAKHNVEFAALYLDQQRRVIRYFNLGTLVFSSGGIMGWRVWEGAPVVACGIIAVVSLMRLVQPQIIMNDKQVMCLDRIHDFYFNFYNQLERLWYDMEDGSLSEDIIKERFFEIKCTEAEINQIIGEVIREKPRRLVQKAKYYSDKYFSQTFNTDSDESKT